MADLGSEKIPSPPGVPVLGNLWDINVEEPVQSLYHMAEQYGDIYRFRILGRSTIVVSSNALINECCDETRFKKNIGAVLKQVRNGVHDGLFTAYGESEPNWGKAHRVLTPAFGPMSISNMFDEMHDIASQLALKWARLGPNEPIMVTDDFTRLTLDTLALCAMDYRFNSFYSPELHPFIKAMGGYLVESGSRSRRPPLPSYFYKKADQQYWADIAVLHEVSDGVLQARKKQDPPSERKDLLAAMLHGKDPRTGEMLDDETITNNLITFLIAGHETTSGLLSFACFQLLRNPDAYRAAQQEVDEVVGTGPITVDHLPKLKYIAAVLRETLRINPTIPAFTVAATKDEILGGKYFVPAGEDITLLLMRAHHDPAVFGDDANEFKPERMLDENFARLNKEHPNCWKPFGNGARACIGRPFAWQEALLVMAMLLQNFNLRFDDASYQLHLKETLTMKPKEFYMRAHLREGLTATVLEHRLAGSQLVADSGAKKNVAIHAAGGNAPTPVPRGKPLNVYYGSNSGTCEAMSNRLAADAATHGFRADVVAPLDDTNQSLPTDRPVVVVTASYEGEPPDNAGHFVAWLKGLKADEGAKGVAYAVFGCGHHDWAQTFHKIPKLVDTQLAACGAERLAPIGTTDAADGNMFEDFEAWEDKVLFPALKARYGTEAQGAEGGKDGAEGEAASVLAGLTVEVTTPRTSALRQDVREAQVVETRKLTLDAGDGDKDAGVKQHIEIQLPSDVSYKAGDYLAVLPFNNKSAIERALRRFRLPWDAHITVRTPDGSSTSTQTNLPINTPVPAYGVLGAYVELGQPATKRNILALAEAASDKVTKSKLEDLAGDAYAAEITAKKVSILDLLDRFPKVDLPFGHFLALLPPMRVRQYSISSSPLWNPRHVTLTYSVLTSPALSGQGLHEGVASHYLASLTKDDTVHVAVKPSHAAFHLPHDAENVPLVCVAAGTGLAPFRGFVQERAALLGAGRRLAPALLFFGCRSPADDLYRDELDRWAQMGAVDVRRAYSQDTGHAAAQGCRHVQDRLHRDRADVVKLWEQGARVYVCGSRQVGDAVKQTALHIRQEWMASAGKSETDEEAAAWFAHIRNERYATDVFD